jgi:hypothetical protein
LAMVGEGLGNSTASRCTLRHGSLFVISRLLRLLDCNVTGVLVYVWGRLSGTGCWQECDSCRTLGSRFGMFGCKRRNP